MFARESAHLQGPAHPGERKKGQTFEKVKDKDVVTDVAGKCAAELKAPNANKCRVIAEFEGDATHAPSEATKTFDCG